MLISAGRLGPANMAKSKKKMRKEADTEKRKETDGEKYTVPLQTGQRQKDTVRGHERDLI